MILFLFWTFMLSFLLIFCGFLAHTFGHSSSFDWLSWAGWGGVSVVIFATIGQALIKTLKAAATCLQEKLLPSHPGSEPAPAEQPDSGRRRFLRYAVNTSLFASSGLLAFHGISEAARLPRVKNVAIGIKNLPPDLEGLSIALITDLHISRIIRQDYVYHLVQQVNLLEPDIIAFTGDIVDGSCEDLSPDAAPLADLVSKHGTFCVTGNHEYWYGADEWMVEMERMGFTILLNEHRLVEKSRGSILVGGVADYSAPAQGSHDSSPADAIKGAPPADVKILLAHQPISVYDAAEAGFDLQLSGHTHGGQISLAGWLPCMGQPYLTGLHQHEDMQIYVSNGAGYWGPPLRIGAPSEITLLKLTGKKTTPG